MTGHVMMAPGRGQSIPVGLVARLDYQSLTRKSEPALTKTRPAEIESI